MSAEDVNNGSVADNQVINGQQQVTLPSSTVPKSAAPINQVNNSHPSNTSVVSSTLPSTLATSKLRLPIRFNSFENEPLAWLAYCGKKTAAMDEATRILVFGESLVGEAQQWFLDEELEDEHRSWTQWCEAFRRRFLRDKSTLRNELNACLMQPGECFANFYGRFARLVRQVQPTMSESEKLDRLLRGLPAQLQDIAAFMKVNTVEELKNRMAHYNAERPHVKPPQMVEAFLAKSMDGQAAEISRLSRMVEELARQRDNDRRRPAKRPKSEVICYRCGEKGHYSRECSAQNLNCSSCGNGGHVHSVCKYQRSESHQSAASGKDLRR